MNSNWNIQCPNRAIVRWRKPFEGLDGQGTSPKVKCEGGPVRLSQMVVGKRVTVHMNRMVVDGGSSTNMDCGSNQEIKSLDPSSLGNGPCWAYFRNHQLG